MPDKKVNIKQITDYLPDPENANQGTEYGAHVIEKSVRELGPGRSLLADKNNVLIAGNKTQQALIDAGITEVIEITPEPGQVVVVKRPDLDLLEDDEVQTARRMAYTDNRASEVSLKWDAAQILEDMKNGIPLNDVFTEDELIGFGAIEPKEEDFKPDKAEALREKWGVEVGQLWQLGEHRVICGDCTEDAVVDRLMGGEKAGVVVTDPPYGISREGITNDDPERIQDLFEKCIGVLPAENTVIIAFQSPKMFYVWLFTILDYGHKFNRALWMHDETRLVTFPWRGWVMTSDIIIISSVGNPLWQKPRNYKHDCLVTGGKEETALDGSHTTIKPLDIVMNLVDNVAGIVYDPFLGSGTTLIACENLGRNCMGIELEPKYIATTLERYHQHTGNTPVLQSAQS